MILSVIKQLLNSLRLFVSLINVLNWSHIENDAGIIGCI